ncbi:MAG: hypothetical protein ACO3EM_08515, partial [Ilumatobacteraceae bacterium]
MEIALAVAVVVLALVVVLQARRKPAAAPTSAAPVAPDDLTARVELAAQKALNDAVARLSVQAE